MRTAGWKITFFFSFMYIIFLIGEIVPCENIVHNNNNNNNSLPCTKYKLTPELTVNRLNAATPAFYINTQGFSVLNNISTNLFCVNPESFLRASLSFSSIYLFSCRCLLTLVVLWQSFLSSFSPFRKPSASVRSSCSPPYF